MLLSQLKEVTEIFVISFEIEPPSLNFMVVPHDVDAEGVEAHRLDHHDPVLPVFDWDPGVVDFAGIKLGILLRVEAASIHIGLEGLISPTVMQIGRHARDENEEHRRNGCVLINVGRNGLFSITCQGDVAGLVSFVHILPL